MCVGLRIMFTTPDVPEKKLPLRKLLNFKCERSRGKREESRRKKMTNAKLSNTKVTLFVRYCTQTGPQPKIMETKDDYLMRSFIVMLKVIEQNTLFYEINLHTRYVCVLVFVCVCVFSKGCCAFMSRHTVYFSMICQSDIASKALKYVRCMAVYALFAFVYEQELRVHFQCKLFHHILSLKQANMKFVFEINICRM